MKPTTIVLSFLVLVATGCQQPDPSQKLKPVGNKYAEVWNTGKVTELDAIIDPHFVRHANLQPDLEGVDGLKKIISGFRGAYPDFKLVLNEEIYSENKSVSRWTVTGTNTGPGEMPPTGKPIKIWGTSTLHYANGMISDEWVSFDNQSLMEQLGFTMTPPAAAKP